MHILIKHISASPNCSLASHICIQPGLSTCYWQAAQAISSYHDTFNTAALLAGPSELALTLNLRARPIFHQVSNPNQGADGFEHLVDEQTPGGMNERIIRELENGGNYANLTVAMKHLLPKLVGE